MDASQKPGGNPEPRMIAMTLIAAIAISQKTTPVFRTRVLQIAGLYKKLLSGIMVIYRMKISARTRNLEYVNPLRPAKVLLGVERSSLYETPGSA